MHLLVWQARNLDAGVNMDGFGGTCIYLLWHAPQPACHSIITKAGGWLVFQAGGGTIGVGDGLKP